MKGRAERRIFYSADNGGTDRGSNWPLRGSKHSNCALCHSNLLSPALLRWICVGWAGEGGMRAAAFVRCHNIAAVWVAFSPSGLHSSQGSSEIVVDR